MSTTQRRAPLPGLAPVKHLSPEYNEYIESEIWKQKSLSMKEVAEFRCACCNREFRVCDLHTHHMSYHGLGSESSEQLLVLCRECHNRFHEVRSCEIKEVMTLLRRINANRRSWTKDYLAHEQELMTEILATAVVKATAGHTGQYYARAAAYFGIYQIIQILPHPFAKMQKQFTKELERYKLPSPGGAYLRRAKEYRDRLV